MQEDTYRGDGLNLYAYCANNPVRYVDPSGHWCEKKEDIYKDLVEKNGLDINNIDPDTRQRLMAEAANEARRRRKAASSEGKHTPRLPGPVLPEQNQPSRPGADVPDGGRRGEGGSGADNIANAARLKEYYKQAEKYGTGSIKELDNGKFRFYEELKPASTKGEMAGARHVREWDPFTGNKRDWYETLDHAGNIRQVRPDPNVTGGVKVHYMFDSNGNYMGSWVPDKKEVFYESADQKGNN